MIEYLDVVTDGVFGDAAKSAVTYELSKGNYSHVLKPNGGSNSGHTIYHNGVKYIAHLIPVGVFHGKKCIIGAGCVVNIKKFFKELNDLKEFGINTNKLVYIAENAHIVTDEHIEEDILEETKYEAIGSTKQGIAPAYRDKYYRKGIRAKDVPELQDYLIDLYEEFYNPNNSIRILSEGCQGFYLDIDWAKYYPFCTSSHCTTQGVLLNAIPPQKVRKVFCLAKSYDTYVGNYKFQPDDEVFNQLQKHGQEIGGTSLRKRQCNWLNLTNLLKALEINGTTDLVISKVDVLREVNKLNDNLYWCVNRNGGTLGVETTYLSSEVEWKQYIVDDMRKYIPDLNVIWRESPTDGLDNINFGYSNRKNEIKAAFKLLESEGLISYGW